MDFSELDHLLRLAAASHGRTAGEWRDDPRPFYIYGAGNVGKDLARILKAHGLPVIALLDRNARPGAHWEGTPLLLPDDASISAMQRAEAHVVMGIFNRDTEMPPVMDLLKRLGYGSVTGFLDVHQPFAAELTDRFWLTGREFYADKQEEIRTTYGLWADETSRALFSSILRFRLTGDYTCLPTPTGADQYFPTGLPAWPGPIRFIDCGAYDGDTLRHLLRGTVPVEAVMAFEPDPVNFPKLSQTAAALAKSSDITFGLFPCGVSSETTQLRFQSGQGEASHASEQGDTVIQCVALDEALPAFRPSLIKMDIEGAEYDALLGARNLIERYRPGLAISVYHRPDHLWSIPLLAQNWLKGGSHYLRLHAHTGFELIYYWIP